MKLFNTIKNIISENRGKLWLAMALIVSLVASGCQSRDLEEPDISDDKANTFYISLNVKVNGQEETRGTTNDQGGSTDGTLGGTTLENTLNCAMLYFCDPSTYEVVAEIEINGVGAPASSGEYKLSKEVEMEDIKDLAGKEHVLLVVGNYSYAPVHNMGKATGNKGAKDASISVDNIDALPIGDFGTAGQLMTFVNVKPFTIDIFKDITGEEEEILDALRNLFTSQVDNTVHMKDKESESRVIDLERAVARIDWRDLPRETAVQGQAATEDKYLPAYIHRLADPGVNLKTYSLQVFNVNPSSYLFRHTSDGTKLSATYTNAGLWGTENSYTSGDKYVWFVGNDWDGEAKSVSFHSDLDESAVPYEIAAEEDHDGKITIENLIKRTPQDNHYPWRYVTENIVPDVYMMSDENLPKYATGVAFTFQLLGQDNTPLKPADLSTTNCPPGILKASTDAGDNTIRITNRSGEYREIEYNEDEGGYVLTYYAFLKHNDASNTVVTNSPEDGSQATASSYPAPMKYGVVRNNIYQIHVKGISTLPFPEKPESFFLSVELKVLAWAKRDIYVSF
ncbi:MAG: fimbria major subunit [Muribaculaceae bacterium]|nr:fimbria major subunit [Muribaculaceae bacterium]